VTAEEQTYLDRCMETARAKYGLGAVLDGTADLCNMPDLRTFDLLEIRRTGKFCAEPVKVTPAAVDWLWWTFVFTYDGQ
jgi:hypothetical protein